MKFKLVATYIVPSLIFLGLTLLLKVAEKNGMIGGDVGSRAFMVLIGLVVAAYGNVVPKQLKQPRASAEAEMRVQSALRVCGWVMTLAGVVFAGIWMIAPESIAAPVSMLALGAAFLVVMFYSLRACRKTTPDTLARP